MQRVRSLQGVFTKPMALSVAVDGSYWAFISIVCEAKSFGWQRLIHALRFSTISVVTLNDLMDGGVCIEEKYEKSKHFKEVGKHRPGEKKMVVWSNFPN